MERGIAARERAAEANRKPLDWLNFLLADARGGVSPFLAMFLMASKHWDAASIGIVLSIAGIATVAAQGPAGALVDSGKPGSLRLVWENKPLVWFTAAITLFHFANAAMLPLAGEKLSQGHIEASPLFMSSCIVVAQLVMVPMAIFVGHKADAWGRKPLFLAGFAVLPLRGFLLSLANDPYSIVATQILDGVGAGIFGALFFIVVADFTRGTGRYNLAQGVSAASWGLGAALSNGVAGGMIVASYGFQAAFSFLAACALGAFAIFFLAVPESRDFRREGGDEAEPELAAEKAKA